MVSNKKVRFGKTTEIEDFCPPPPKNRRNLFWKRYASTWLKEEEMQKKFRADLKEAEQWDPVCVRGLEYHLSKNISRPRHVCEYMESVVQHSLDLRTVAKLSSGLNIAEELRTFAVEMSKDTAEEARKVAKRDAQVALRLHRSDTSSVVATKLRKAPGRQFSRKSSMPKLTSSSGMRRNQSLPSLPSTRTKLKNMVAMSA